MLVFLIASLNRGVYSTSKPDQPKMTNSMVGSGLLPTEPDTFGLIGGFPPQKPEPPDPTTKSTKSGDIQRFFNKNLQILVILLLFWWRATWNLPDPTRSGKISSRSSPDLDWSSKISAMAVKPKTWWTRTRRSAHYYGSVLALFFTHPNFSCRVRFGNKPNSA